MLAAGADRITLINPYAVPLKRPAHLTMLIKDCARLELNCDDVLTERNFAAIASLLLIRAGRSTRNILCIPVLPEACHV